ncbi:hypothetical protein J7L60_00330 [Candidatus Bathyarchaeota archaeon]|nr:hypothetical protein [Candidatus Bathyarchaeota archaeon]
MLLIFLFFLIPFGRPGYGETSGIAFVGQSEEYYINKGYVSLQLYDDGSASVWVEMYPKFLVNRTCSMNISIPYVVSAERIGISCSPDGANFTIYQCLNETKVEVQLSEPVQRIMMTYLLDDIVRDGEVGFEFSVVAFTKELELNIHTFGEYCIKYSSLRTSPQPSIKTYLLPFYERNGPRNLLIKMGNVNPVTIRINFKIYLFDVKRDLLIIIRSSLISLVVPFLTIFLSSKVYGERLNTFTLALRNNLRRKGKFYITLFGLSTMVSLIASILLQSHVISGLIQSTGEGAPPSLQPYIYLLLGITLLVGGFLVFETNLSSVLARKVELAILKALGFHTLGVTKMIITEGLFLGLLSGIIGSLAGTLFATSPYIRFTNYHINGVPVINTYQKLMGGASLLIMSAISFAIGWRYLGKIGKAVKVASATFVLNFAQFFTNFALRPFITIPLLVNWPLIAAYCALTILFTLFFSALAALYPSIKAGVTRPIEMMKGST